MAGRPVSLTEVVSAAARSRQAHIHTAIPGKVKAYDAATGLADVEPMVNDFFWNEDGERVFEEPPVFPGIPVVWPRAGGYVLTMPLTVGDFVWIMYSERSLAEWRSTGQKSDPVDASRHDGYAVCIPGAFPDTTPLANGDTSARQAGLIIGKNGAVQQIRINGSYLELGAGADDFVATKSYVEAELEKIRGAFNQHVHATAAVGPPVAPTVVPGVIPIPAIGNVGSTLVKLKK